jgi:hypothetical protein
MRYTICRFSILNDAPTPDAHSNDPLPLITMDGRSSGLDLFLECPASCLRSSGTNTA